MADIDKVRKAYNKVQAAMVAAKEAGDAEQLARLKPDYTALKEMLQQAKQEQADTERVRVEAIEKELEAAKAEITKLKNTLREYRDDNDRLRDENQSLRAPPPMEEYKKAQLMHPTMTPPMNAAAFEKAADAIFGAAV